MVYKPQKPVDYIISEDGGEVKLIDKDLLSASKEFKTIYTRLKNELNTDVAKMTGTELMKALNNVSRRIIESTFLLGIVSDLNSAFIIQYDGEIFPLKKQAQTELGKLKKSGEISGQVTGDLVKEWLACNSPGYVALEQRRIKLESNLKIITAFCKVWEKRTNILLGVKDLMISGQRNNS